MGKKVVAGLVQTNIRLSEFSDKKLKRLAGEAELTIGAFIEKMLDCYQQPSKPSNLASSVSDDWHSAVDDLSNRLLVLETRLGALEVVGAVRVGAVEEVTVGAAVEPVDVVADTVDTEAGINQGVAQKADMPTETDSMSCDAVVIIQGIDKFKAAVVAAYESGMRGYAEILKKLTAVGYRNSKGNKYTRHSVKEHLIAAGLVKAVKHGKN